MNILNNAVQSIHGEGKITVTTEAADGMVHIIVADTGAGMTPEVQERIFDPFFTTKEIGRGTGLGLSISMGIIKTHGGRIVAESMPGHGSIFTITLPVDQVPEI